MVDDERLYSVVVVEDSGGAASAICHAIDVENWDDMLPTDQLPPVKFPEEWFRTPENLHMLSQIRQATCQSDEIGRKRDFKICRFGLEQPEASLSNAFLRAALQLDPDRPERQLRLAVQFDCLEEARKMLSNRRVGRDNGRDASNASLDAALKDALQCAFEHRRALMVEVLLEKRARLSEVNVNELFDRDNRRNALISYLTPAAKEKPSDVVRCDGRGCVRMRSVPCGKPLAIACHACHTSWKLPTPGSGCRARLPCLCQHMLGAYPFRAVHFVTKCIFSGARCSGSPRARPFSRRCGSRRR
jgi:hypothetical protein